MMQRYHNSLNMIHVEEISDLMQLWEEEATAELMDLEEESTSKVVDLSRSGVLVKEDNEQKLNGMR